MRAYWGVGETRLACPDDLRDVVDRVRRLGAPTMLFLEGDATLVVGLGAPESVLTYYEPTGASFHSIGDVAREDRLVFQSQGVPEEFLAEMAVDEQLAIDAAFEFFSHPRATGWRSLGSGLGVASTRLVSETSCATHRR
jgi:hypothetical protein